VDSSGINYQSFNSSSTYQDASQPVLFVEDKTNPSLYMAWIEELAGTSNVTVARYINNTWNYVRTL